MGFGKELFENTVNTAADTASSGLAGAGVNLLTNLFKPSRKELAAEQLKNQANLSRLQFGFNNTLMENSFEKQLELWNATNAEAQVAHLKAAGLNPALMYAKGGAGGSTGSGGASVGGGTASDAASLENAETSRMMAGMAMQKMASEIAVNKSVANKNNAEAQTTEESRSNLVAKLYEEGFGQAIKNAQERYKMNATPDGRYVELSQNNSDKYGEITVEGNSLFTQELATAITKAKADTGNSEAQALLTNEKAKGYWQELLNDTARADNDKIKATATKLAAEWQTGEYTNWKTWADLARGVFKDVFQSIK